MKDAMNFLRRLANNEASAKEKMIAYCSLPFVAYGFIFTMAAIFNTEVF